MKNYNATKPRVPPGPRIPVPAVSSDYPGSWEGRRNRIRCLKCEDVIEATHQHDYKSCKCGRVSVDGGALGHWRRIGGADSYVEMP